MSSLLGRIFRISTFGESHGSAVGVVIDGCPSGLTIDVDLISQELARRRPGQSTISSPRKEPDEIQIMSGLYQQKTIGSPICLLVINKDQRGKDYVKWEDIFRPSHADYTSHIKYAHRNPLGGGRSSARETIGRVAAGAIAQQILQIELGVKTNAWVEKIHTVTSSIRDENEIDRKKIEASIVRCPDLIASEKMVTRIKEAQKDGNSLGGIIRGYVQNVPPGLGEPVFGKLDAEISKACLSIPACKGFEVGSGFSGTELFGSEHNDPFYNNCDESPIDQQIQGEKKSKPSKRQQSSHPVIKTKTNHSGGIQGGISNGMPITVRLAFKPTATIHRQQETVNAKGESKTIRPGGRHDPCVLPRAVPIVEAMLNLVLVDCYLLQRALNPKWYQQYQI